MVLSARPFRTLADQWSQGWTTSVWTGPGPGPTDQSRPIGPRPNGTDVSVRSQSHLNDSDVGPVQFSKTISLVSVPVQDVWTDQLYQDGTNWTM